MKVIFRVDASILIGSGHVMRCLTLADELKRQGYGATFIIRNHHGHLVNMIEARGYSTVLLPLSEHTLEKREGDVAHAHWLGVPWEVDVKQTRQAIGEFKPDWLVVDHYGIDARWHLAIRDNVKRILVIDDLADRDLNCDLLLDQTYGRELTDYRNLVPSNCGMLLGSQYALLQEEFAKLRPMAIVKRKYLNHISKIFLSIGAIDHDNVTGRILDVLALVEWEKLPFIDVVLGSRAPNLSMVEKQIESHPLNVSLSVDVSDMAKRMVDADLSIGAGGTTSWERCCLGLPTILITIAENQRKIAEVLDVAGAIYYLGDQSSDFGGELVRSLNLFQDDVNLLKQMSNVCFKVSDGLGVRRVVVAMSDCEKNEAQNVRLRPLSLADTELIYGWQKSERIRRYFNNPSVPSYDEHVAWIKGRVEDVASYTDIIIYQGKPVGVLRLDPADTDIEDLVAYVVSIYIVEDYQKMGIASKVLELVNHIMFDRELRAEIHKDNVASQVLFKRAGFIESDKADIYYRKAKKFIS